MTGSSLARIGLGMLFALALVSAALATEPVHVPMDLQGHPAMHLCWKFYGKGLTDRTPKRTFRHQFRQSVYTRA